MKHTTDSAAVTALVLSRFYSTHAPTRYDPAFSSDMLHYFANASASAMRLYSETVEQEEVKGKPTRKHKAEARAVCGEVPTFQRFANSIGITVNTLEGWGRKHPEFGYAYARCQDMLKDFLIQAGVAGRIPPAVMIFVSKNLTDMRDEATLNVQASQMSQERPVLADKTPEQLTALKELVEKAGSLGLKVRLLEAVVEEEAEEASADVS